MDKEKEQKLKEEFINSALKTEAILRKVGLEVAADDLENVSERIESDWKTEKEMEANGMREQKPAEKQERVKEEQEKKQARAEDIIEGADSLEEAEKQLEEVGF